MVKKAKVVEIAKVVCYRFKGAAPHIVALYLQGNLNTESGSVNEACKKKEHFMCCARLDCSLIYT